MKMEITIVIIPSPAINTKAEEATVKEDDFSWQKFRRDIYIKRKIFIDAIKGY